MKLTAFLATIFATTTLNLQAQSEWKDVTSTYIVNPGFEDCIASTSNVATSAKGNSADYKNNGWAFKTLNTNQWCCSAVMAYGTAYTFSGTTPPTTDNAGNAGNALAINIGRTYDIRYVSNTEVTLPAGHYRLTAHYINLNTATPYKSLLGFIPTTGSAFLSTLTSVPNGTWTTDVVEFSLESETIGVFQVGGQGTNLNIATGNHAKLYIDNLILEYKSPFASLLDEAYSMEVPTENIGDGDFQFSQTNIDAFNNALTEAQNKYDNDSYTDDDITTLRTAMDNCYQLNPVSAGSTYKLQLAYSWSEGHQYEHLNMGYVTLANTLANQGGYVLSIGTTTEAYTDESYLAQQFTLSPVNDVLNGYTLSLVDKEGNLRYICSGTKVGGNNSQIRTSTSEADALTIIIEYAGMKDGQPSFHLYSSEAPANTWISFSDRNSYCWPTSNQASSFYLHAKNTEHLPSVDINLKSGQFATCIFPFTRTSESNLVSDLLKGKVNVYTCSQMIEGSSTLDLIPLEGTLQAHVPYILEATSDFNTTLKGLGTAYETTTEYTSGLLIGTYATGGYVPEGCYDLQIQDDHQAFYRMDNSSTPIAPYCAYIDVSGLMNNPMLHLTENCNYTIIDFSFKAEYGTLILPFDAEIPSGMEAYTCESVETNGLTMILKQAESIEANTPYIIKKTSEINDYTFSGMAVNSQDSYTPGLLTGTLIDTTAPIGSLVLQDQPTGLGFYAVDSDDITIKANRVYVTEDAVGTNIRVLILPNNTTDINEIKTKDIIVDVYTIDGIKVKKDTKVSTALDGLNKGIYIVNGKKIMK